MTERYTKQGETRQATDDDYLWLRGLLRYVRNVDMLTPDPSGWGTNITPMFAGLTFAFRPGQLCLLFNSYPSTDHAQFITCEHEQAAKSRQLHLPNVDLHLANTFSKEVTLRMKARAYELTDPDEKTKGLIALNAVRRLKGWPAISLEPKNDEDSPRALYVADVLSADTQGERFSEQGNHVGEGHPGLDVAQLEGFEAMPRYIGWRDMPNTKEELARYQQRAERLQQLGVFRLVSRVTGH